MAAHAWERPADGILDPDGRLAAEVRQELAGQLSSYRNAGGLDVIVVMLGQVGGEDPRALALELANRWGDASGRAVILDIEGWNGTPWIAISGRIREEIPGRMLEAIRAKAEQRAKAATGAENRVRDGVAELTDELRFLRATLRGGRIVEVEKKMPYSVRDMVFILARKLPLLAGAVSVLIGLSFFAWRGVQALQRRLVAARPLEFPSLVCKRRLGAPHGAAVHSSRGRRPLTGPVSRSTRSSER